LLGFMVGLMVGGCGRIRHAKDAPMKCRPRRQLSPMVANSSSAAAAVLRIPRVFAGVV
jgi:hypothetical protein